jgi:hypothetical protein
MSGTGLQSGADRGEQLRPLGKIRDGEGSFREGPLTLAASITRDAPSVIVSIAAGRVVCELLRSLDAVVCAITPWAELGDKTPLILDGLNRPAHDQPDSTLHAREKSRRRASQIDISSAAGQHKPAVGHRRATSFAPPWS